MELMGLVTANAELTLPAIIKDKMAYRYARMICGFNDANASHDRGASASYAPPDKETLKKFSRNDEDFDFAILTAA